MFVPDSERDMDGRQDFCGRIQMCFLIIKENMGFEYFKNFSFFNTAEKKGLIYGYSPTAHCVNHTLVGGGISSSNNCNT